MDPPYLRFCRVCNATHLYEMPFRLAALRAGLELQPDASPPVLRRSPATSPPRTGAGVRPDPRLPAAARPATPKQVADYLDAPVADVKERWPADVVEVSVDGETRSVAGRRRAEPSPRRWRRRPAARTVRPVPAGAGPFAARRRPGPSQGPLAGAGTTRCSAGRRRLAGVWRPRKSGKSLTVLVEPWTKPSAARRKAIAAQADLLAAHRHVALSAVDYDG